MLTHTFCHIPGIGEKTERNLWSAGVTSWDAALPQAGINLACAVRESWTRHIEESAHHHKVRNARYFAENLPPRQHWRLYRDFQDSCAFIDIETTGLFDPQITTIALYDGRSIRTYVTGQNLDEFASDIMDYRLLVTYNGKRFDIPLIEQHFSLRLPQAHIDLRYPLHGLGLMGGLKGCERQLGLARPGLEDVDGFVAVLLWQDYQRRKNDKALETLLAYNVCDTVALHTLIVHTHNAKLKETSLTANLSLPPPQLPEIPFSADRDTVERLLPQTFGSSPGPEKVSGTD